MPTNYHVVLQSRPGADAAPQEDNFKYEKCPYPSEDIKPGEVLLRTCYLSVDPALRCTLNEDTGVDYVKPVEIGKTVIGFGGLGVVLGSQHPEYSPGDLIQVALTWPWILYYVANIAEQPDKFRKVDKDLIGGRPSLVVSLTGVGLTALLGIEEKGHVIEGANQTCVVSGAAGATGSLAGQIARLKGCSTVVGICGTRQKCEWIVSELGFSAAINYKEDDVAARLRETCPGGVDVYFDNVGGEISNTIIKQMNAKSHVVLCGQISQYNKDLPYPPPIPEGIEKHLAERNITR